MTDVKMGRPLIELDLKLLEELCTIGCTDSELAACLDVSLKTIENRKREDEEFLRIYKRGHESGKMSLRRRQWQKAMEGNIGMLIWLGKQLLGQKDQLEHTATDFTPVRVILEDSNHANGNRNN